MARGLDANVDYTGKVQCYFYFSPTNQRSKTELIADSNDDCGTL